MHQVKQPAAFLPLQTQGTPERKKVYDDGESSRVARAELGPTSRIVIIKKKKKKTLLDNLNKSCRTYIKSNMDSFEKQPE